MGAINNWLPKSPAAPWKSLTQTQLSEAQLNVVVKDGEEIGATILYCQRTPTEIRQQTKQKCPFNWWANAERDITHSTATVVYN